MKYSPNQKNQVVTINLYKFWHKHSIQSKKKKKKTDLGNKSDFRDPT